MQGVVNNWAQSNNQKLLYVFWFQQELDEPEVIFVMEHRGLNIISMLTIFYEKRKNFSVVYIPFHWMWAYLDICTQGNQVI